MGKRKKRARSDLGDGASLTAAKAEALRVLASVNAGAAPSTSASPPPTSPSTILITNGNGKERAMVVALNGGGTSRSVPKSENGKKIRLNGGEGTASREEQPGEAFIGPVAPPPRPEQQQQFVEEIPTTAFLDFLDAATDEFIVMNPHLVGPSDIVLPQTTEAQLAKSILYYSDPGPITRAVTKPPPKPQLQYLPMSADPEPRSVAVPSRGDKGKRRMAPEDSDLDDDEFADVFGEAPVVNQDVSDADEAQEDYEEDQEESYEEEAWEVDEGEEMASGRTSAEVENSLVAAASTVGGPAVSSTRPSAGDDMDVSSSAPATPPLLPSAPPPAVAAPSQSSLPGFDPATLTEPQRAALTNALSAQFWAGYHTALLQRSLSHSSSPAAPTTSHPHHQQQPPPS